MQCINSISENDTIYFHNHPFHRVSQYHEIITPTAWVKILRAAVAGINRTQKSYIYLAVTVSVNSACVTGPNMCLAQGKGKPESIISGTAVFHMKLKYHIPDC